MTPHPFSVVVERTERLAALGHVHDFGFSCFAKTFDALHVHVELDAVEGPRLLKFKQLTREVGVTHTPT